MLDKFDATFLLLPKLEVTITTCSDDEVGLGGDAVTQGVPMP